MSRSLAGIFGVLIFLAAACTPFQAQARPGPTPPVDTFAGGCAGTVLTDAEPPKWAQGGWHTAVGTPAAPWPVPWAMGKPADAVAFVFAGQLVAGGSPRVNGTNNKVLWVTKDPTSISVVGTPLGKSQPVVNVAGGPSITDVPTPGCWTFRLAWGLLDHQGSSVINLDVLPAVSLP